MSCASASLTHREEETHHITNDRGRNYYFLFGRIRILLVIMIANCATSFVRVSSRVQQPLRVASQVTRRSMATRLSDAQTAGCAWKKSCYNGIDYTIGDECTVFEGERMVRMCRPSDLFAYIILSISYLFAKRSKSWLRTMLVALLLPTRTVSKRLGAILLCVRQSLSVSLITSLSRRLHRLSIRQAFWCSERT